MAGEQGGPRGFQMSDDEAHALPEMSFATLVLSLSTSALLHLGVAPPEAGGGEKPPEPNLPLARQTIDILEILRDKTRGNLDGAESSLLDQVLHDLRLRYVALSKGAK